MCLRIYSSLTQPILEIEDKRVETEVLDAMPNAGNRGARTTVTGHTYSRILPISPQSMAPLKNSQRPVNADAMHFHVVLDRLIRFSNRCL